MRTDNDLSHPIATVGGIGHIQTLTKVPIIAGDSIGFKLSGKLRLSPLRRSIVLDPKVDLCAFFVPHRHVYGQTWIDWVKGGVDSGITLPGLARGTKRPYYLAGSPHFTEGMPSLPRWAVVGYNQIFNRYFRVPTDQASVKVENWMPDYDSDPDTQEYALSNYGAMAPRLKTVLSTPVYTAVDQNDRRLELRSPSALQGASQQVLDLTDLASIKARYRSEQEREWLYVRYADLLSGVWPGAHANTDADQRPTMLARQSFFLSGYDQSGNDDATLGTFQGNSEGRIQFSMPNRLLPEHGTLWILAVVRYPSLYHNEGHFLEHKADPSYRQFAGEHTIVAGEAPKEYRTQEFFGTTSTGSIGHAPYGQWYRFHPPRIHPLFKDREGYPFLTGHQQTRDELHYHQPNEYKHVFQTRVNGEWEYTGNCEMHALRSIPAPMQSLFVGTD